MARWPARPGMPLIGFARTRASSCIAVLPVPAVYYYGAIEVSHLRECFMDPLRVCGIEGSLRKGPFNRALIRAAASV
jgi:hypothetical protein